MMTQDQILRAQQIRLEAAQAMLLELMGAVDGVFDEDPSLKHGERLSKARRTAYETLDFIRGQTYVVPDDISERVSENVGNHKSAYAVACLKGEKW
jgi:hypothetical protein